MAAYARNPRALDRRRLSRAAALDERQRMARALAGEQFLERGVESWRVGRTVEPAELAARKPQRMAG